MKPFSFIHAADLHLGTPFSGISSCDEEWRQILIEAPFQAFERIISLSIEHQVDFLLLSGDIYDSARQNLRAQIRFVDGLNRLSEYCIATYIAFGNHDVGDKTGSRLRWPDLVYRFPEGELATYPIEKNGQRVAEVIGLSYPQQNITENYTNLFQPSGQSPFSIGVLHANVGGQPGTDNYAPCALTDLTASAIDYWALGHVHTATILNSTNPWVVYSGTPQGRSPRETGIKGCYLVEVVNGQAQLKFLPTNWVLWHNLTLDITNWERLDDLILSVEKALTALSEQEAGSGARFLVVRLKLVGRGPLHRELHLVDNSQAVLEDLRSRSFLGWERVWFDDLILQTGLEIDKEAESCSETITADYLQLSTALQQELQGLNKGEARLVKELQQLIEPLYKQCLRRYLELPTEQELVHLVQEAEDLGLDLLVGEEDY